MEFNATFNNSSAIWWRIVLMVEETGVPEKTTDLSQVTDNINDIMLHWVHLASAEFELTALLVICTDCTGSCRSNYHAITTTTIPMKNGQSRDNGNTGHTIHRTKTNTNKIPPQKTNKMSNTENQKLGGVPLSYLTLDTRRSYSYCQVQYKSIGGKKEKTSIWEKIHCLLRPVYIVTANAHFVKKTLE